MWSLTAARACAMACGACAGPACSGEDHLLHVGVLKELGASAMTDDVAIVLHDWGYGCGACPACQLRARGWAGWAGQRNAGG